MATPKKKHPLISDGKTPLVWRKHPDGWQYAHYKMGSILRYKGKYNVKLYFNDPMIHASSLKDAKAKIDKYTEKRLKQQGLI